MAHLTEAQQEAKWRAQSDAGSLAEAHAITNDPARLKAAIAVSKEMAEEAEEDAERSKDRADGFEIIAAGSSSIFKKDAKR